MNKQQTTQELLTSAEEALQVSETPRLDAEVLLAALLGVNRSRLYAYPDAVIDKSIARDFHCLLEDRKDGCPVAYLTGNKEFFSMRFNVNANTLIPRAETETLVELALEHMPADHTGAVLDLGTGSGAIAIAIAASRPGCAITAVDISIEALKVARENALSNNITNITFLQSDWFGELQNQRYDVIVSNPPYVDYLRRNAMANALKYEPRAALDGGHMGREHLQSIIAGARQHLTPGGFMITEHGWDQGEFVRSRLVSHHYEDVRTHTDLAGHERYGFASRP